MDQDEVLQARVFSRGRITIPKELRERLGLQPGDEVDFTEAGDGYRISRKNPDADRSPGEFAH